MDRNVKKQDQRVARKKRVRKAVFGTSVRPRLSVFRSNLQIYAQIIDDISGRTLVSASSLSEKAGQGRPGAQNVGKALAQRAVAAGIGTVAFDRSGYRYHGRVRALADAAREGGLKF